MNNYLKTLFLLAASILAASCSTRHFGSEEDANIAAEKYILDAAFSDQVSVVSIGTGESEKIRFARMCARRPKENKIVCEERKPKKEKMTLKEWDSLKVSYTYFHY